MRDTYREGKRERYRERDKNRDKDRERERQRQSVRERVVYEAYLRSVSARQLASDEQMHLLLLLQRKT